MSDTAIVFIYKLGDEFILSPSQRRTAKLFVPALTFLRAPTSVSDEELGRISLQALERSAELPEVPDVDPAAREKEWQTAIVREAGMRSYKEFQRSALNVNVYRYEDDRIQVAPTIHEKGWFLIKNLEMEELSAPSAESLGAVIGMSFERSE
jgi:hypothetical protein